MKVLASLVAVGVLMLGAPSAMGAEGIFGTWDFTLKYEGNDIKVGLSLAKNSNDRIVGLWAVGENWTTLPKVTYVDGKLTFNRTVEMNGQEIVLKHEATFDGDKIKGKIVSPQGELSFEGVKRVAKVAGRSGRGRGEGGQRGGFDLVSIIEQADADGDGKMQKSEAPEQIKRFFDMIDSNGDGAIDKEEAKTAMEQFSNR